MSWISRLLGRKTDSGPGKGRKDPPLPHDSYGPVTRDTKAAIAELARVARNNPDAVEIYLALGNLYRSHGEIERAIQIRHNLIVRPGLDDRFKGKAWFELGQDYRRGGFMDRALDAFEQARALDGDTERILWELARLRAQSGEHLQAARLYSQLGHPVAEAHHYVRLSREMLEEGDQAKADKWLTRALKVHPGSPEAWLESLDRAFAAKDWELLASTLDQALVAVEDRLGFAVVEGMLARAATRCPEDGQPETPFRFRPCEDLCRTVLPVLESREPDLLLHYYAAWIVCPHDPQRARTLLEKTLLLSPEFWPARLELLALALDDQPLTPAFRKQLEFFITRASKVKRFLCGKCGLKREGVFFVCPRCHSWHSITYRMVLND